MRNIVAVLCCVLGLTACATTESSTATPQTYDETVAQWSSYRDVATWMDRNFRIDWDRSDIRGWQARGPEDTFVRKTGVCQDSAAFTRAALNRINPEYRARIVYVKNDGGPRDHWVTAFTMDGKLYIMDYGAGGPWTPMIGLHGPYESFKDYEKFLMSLHVPRFHVQFIRETGR